MKPTLLFLLLISPFPSLAQQGLQLMPEKGNVESDTPNPAEGANQYWLMTNGDSVGYRLAVQINGENVSTIHRPQEALEVTNHIQDGLNVIRFSQTRSSSARVSGAGSMTITLGPELKRERRGGGWTYIQLKENPVHFTRTVRFPGEGEIDLRFSVGGTPHPELTNRYLLYSMGDLSGHKIEVALNEAPLVDVAGPGTYFDLNAFLAPGKNEFAFSVSQLNGFPMSEKDREALAGKYLEVGVAVVGKYDPASYEKSVSSVSDVVLRFSQPADREEPEPEATLTLIAE